ncbi:MAG: amidohydrolase, partial [Mycobacterium sp.]|nr:amidohydrolase [Mycobacterium sp.]
MRELPKVVSADDHVVEPPNVWMDRLPAKYKDVGPRVVRASAEMSFFGGKFTHKMGGDGPLADWWLYEDLQWPQTRLGACAGFEPDEVKVEPITFDEMRPGCYEQKGRLEDMDLNWTEASLCFPTFPRFCGQTFYEAKDKDLALLCVKAYNDWMVEEWCGGSGGRLVPLCIIPLWDPKLAAAEIRRNAARGVKAVTFSEQPPHLGLPSIHDKNRYWDPVMEACNETGTVVCMHSGSGSKMPSTSADAPPAVGSTLTHELAEQSMADWLFSGLLAKYPDLIITYSEGQIGWIPYILDRADRIWEHNRGWNEVRELVPEPPSTYYWGRIYGCFFEDAAGLAQIDAIGPDQ